MNKSDICSQLLQTLLYKPGESLLDTDEVWTVLNDCMKLEVTEDDEEIVAHVIFSFAPGMSEKKVRIRRIYFDSKK